MVARFSVVHFTRILRCPRFYRLFDACRVYGQADLACEKRKPFQSASIYPAVGCLAMVRSRPGQQAALTTMASKFKQETDRGDLVNRRKARVLPRACFSNTDNRSKLRKPTSASSLVMTDPLSRSFVLARTVWSRSGRLKRCEYRVGKAIRLSLRRSMTTMRCWLRTWQLKSDNQVLVRDIRISNDEQEIFRQRQTFDRQ